MPALTLPDPATPERTFQALADGDAWSGHEPLVLKVQEGAWVDCATIAFLACWGHAQRASGRKVILVGDAGFLGRMHLHKALGVESPRMNKRDARGRFLPVRLVGSLENLGPVVKAVSEIFAQQVEGGDDLVVAMQWIVSELLENVFLHAATDQPAAICAQHLPNGRRIDLAICDVGQGLRASLAKNRPVYSAGHAIGLAVARGVSASGEPGRGNGLAGTLEIARHNHGTTTVWSEDALHTFRHGRDQGFQKIPRIPGTGVALQLSTRQPVRLEDTWIAEVVGFTLLEDRENPNAAVLRVEDECSTTLARSGAGGLVEKLEEQVRAGEVVRLDFEGVGLASTSFLDELLARPVVRLGSELFRERVEVAHMADLTRRLADVAIARRLRDERSLT